MRKALLSNKIDIVFAEGIIDKQISKLCSDLNIIYLDRLSSNDIRQLALLSNTLPIYFAKTLSQSYVGMVRVSTLENRDYDNSNSQFFIIVEYLKSRKAPVTVYITDASPFLTAVGESKFWSCFNRLRNIFNDGSVLPGCGFFELCCISVINLTANDYDKQNNQDATKSEIMRVFSKCMEDFVLKVAQNCGITQTTLVELLNTTKLNYEEYCKKFKLKEGNLLFSGYDREQLMHFEIPTPPLQAIFHNVCKSTVKLQELAVFDSITEKISAIERALGIIFSVLTHSIDVSKMILLSDSYIHHDDNLAKLSYKNIDQI